MNQKKCPGQYSFLGVFFIGLVLLAITGNYYLNKEPGEDREARNRRIATEMNRLHQ